MKKSFLFIVISSVIFLSGCRQSGDKTEIKIQLSEAEYIRILASNTNDSSFLAALNYAQVNSTGETGEFLTVFEKKFTEICPDCRLAALFSTFELRDKITFESTNQDVIKVLNDVIKMAMDESVYLLSSRIRSFCKPLSTMDKLVKKAVVSAKQLPGKNLWLFTVNMKVDKDRLTKLLQSRSDFGIWETYELSEIWNYVSEANNLLKDPSMAEYVRDTSDASAFGRENPLFSILMPSIDQKGELMKGSTIGSSYLRDTALVNKYFALPVIKSLFPRDLKVMWSKTPFSQDKELLNLIAVKVSSRDGLPLLDGQTIVDASFKTKKYPPVLSIRMNAEGARILSRITRDNVGRRIVFVIDNLVCFNALVFDEITGGAMDLTGDLTEDEISDIAVNIGSGNMPHIGVKVTEIN